MLGASSCFCGVQWDRGGRERGGNGGEGGRGRAGREGGFHRLGHQHPQRHPAQKHQDGGADGQRVPLPPPPPPARRFLRLRVDLLHVRVRQLRAPTEPVAATCYCHASTVPAASPVKRPACKLQHPPQHSASTGRGKRLQQDESAADRRNTCRAEKDGLLGTGCSARASDVIESLISRRAGSRQAPPRGRHAGAAPTTAAPPPLSGRTAVTRRHRAAARSLTRQSWFSWWAGPAPRPGSIASAQPVGIPAAHAGPPGPGQPQDVILRPVQGRPLPPAQPHSVIGT